MRKQAERLRSCEGKQSSTEDQGKILKQFLYKKYINKSNLEVIAMDLTTTPTVLQSMT